ncbi:SO_0444 family Cu/Zn efflux transporter [Thiovibrio frasassiensis]|uniref:SO_0444 family Cu/Zn efflux transporter n=1 Tax=Thiovibrio frasassiensis TaxID=2984131 RepID=A0A9X4RMS3_9BACT|nr:SO_0444 family Cu/Zn efflux transporter [Thiovibrio frasassiensis]MDG4477084.1 SO_0444 family Cu/Zn efflux transporter [Thiovibrio frasassiensis]
MHLLVNIFSESWQLLLEASAYILFGILIGGLLKVFLSPSYVARHLGQGRYSSVLKAALLGIPLPLCSCGVLPAAAALKRQGANNGATTAFLISTPESGVDSISVSYALLDPIMTVARPLAALISALIAGCIENTFNPPRPQLAMAADLSCAVDGCCSGIDCPPAEHANHHSFPEKIRAGMTYAFGELWGDLAGWFFAGVLLAGMISALVPDDLITTYLGGGLLTMLLMLAFGIPLYICATASTPIAAAMILKGVSPGAALVFLLVGPATNMATLSVLVGLLGKRATAVYLSCIGITAVIFGLTLDWVYAAYGISAKAVIGQAGEIIPYPLQLAAALLILALSIRPLVATIRRRLRKKADGAETGCGCSGGCEDHGEKDKTT